MLEKPIKSAIPRWATALSGLTDSHKVLVQSKLKRRVVPAGTTFYRQGETGSTFYIIESGYVRTIYHNEDGREYVSGIWPPGYVVGVLSALLQTERVQSAESVDEVSVDCLTRADLVALMERIPLFAVNIACLMAELATHSIQRSGLLALGSATERVARVLLQLAQTSETGVSNVLVCDVSQEQLAQMVGISRPWIARILSSLEQDGLIARGRRSITILDRATLAER